MTSGTATTEAARKGTAEGTVAAAEIAAGAKQLAQELQDFMQQQRQHHHHHHHHLGRKGGDEDDDEKDDFDTNPLQAAAAALDSTDGAVVDLQLATCRKLREVRMIEPLALSFCVCIAGVKDSKRILL